MEASNVPTGWKSSDYLMNHYDRDANTVNFLSACDIPGEVDAECRMNLHTIYQASNIRVTRKTMNSPCAFVWQLIPCEGYIFGEAGGGCTPGLTDNVNCIDSDKIADGTSPSNSAIEVDFVNLNMVLRAYWDISTNLSSYYGRYAFVVLAKQTPGVTDTIKIRMIAHAPTAYWTQDGTSEISTTLAAAGDWPIVEGWNIFTFPVGQDRRDFFSAGNRWRIELHASSTGTTDDLHIAGVYLVPLEQMSISGHSTFLVMQANFDGWISNLDGDKSFTMYSPTTDRYYSNTGYVGVLPTITPEIENYFYLIFNRGGSVDIDEGMTCGLTYRPRGIFLRGTNQ